MILKLGTNSHREKDILLIQVLIIDDHALVRSGIRNLLAQTADIKVCGEAPSGESGLTLISKKPVDVVLLDISLPGMSGIETIKQLLRLKPKLKIIVATAYDNHFFLKFVLNLGAKGYLTKEADATQLQQAIRTVYQDKVYITPNMAQRLAQASIVNATTEIHSPLQLLTEREWQILLMVIQGLETQPIAKKLGLKQRTVNTYRNHILKKLNLETEVQLTHMAIKHKLLEISTLSQSDYET